MKNLEMENFHRIVQLKNSSTLLILLLRIYRLHSSTKIRQAIFRMSFKIYCLQKVKHIKYNINKLRVINLQLIPVGKIIDSYNRLCDSIIIKCNVFRKKEYVYQIEIECSLALKNDSKKSWKRIKKNDDSEESCENNNSTISSDFKSLKSLINRIWIGNFPKSWNNTSIVSIIKKTIYQIVITIVVSFLSIIDYKLQQKSSLI